MLDARDKPWRAWAAEPALSWEQQKALLANCIAHRQPLAPALASVGASLDRLRYAPSSAAQQAPPAAQLLLPWASPKTTPRTRGATLGAIKKQDTWPAISFFAGAGGLDWGLAQAGIVVEACIEPYPICCETLRLNFPQATVVGPPAFSGLVQDEEVDQALKALGCTRPYPGLFVGGPPCQPFSQASFQRTGRQTMGLDHPDGGLLALWVDRILRWHPQAFLLENVPGLLTLDRGQQLAQAQGRLHQAGYTLYCRVLDCASYGVPQHRQRLFMIGLDTPQKPYQWPSPWGDLVLCGQVLAPEVLAHRYHRVRDHKPETVQRYMHLAPGQRDQATRTDRLDPYRPAKTVIGGGLGGGGVSNLHPWIPRTLTVPELMRLQTFPDEYTLAGSTARQFTQVGNAVPPLLASQLGWAIREAMGLG